MEIAKCPSTLIEWVEDMEGARRDKGWRRAPVNSPSATARGERKGRVPRNRAVVLKMAAKVWARRDIGWLRGEGSVVGDSEAWTGSEEGWKCYFITDN